MDPETLRHLDAREHEYADESETDFAIRLSECAVLVDDVVQDAVRALTHLLLDGLKNEIVHQGATY